MALRYGFARKTMLYQKGTRFDAWTKVVQWNRCLQLGRGPRYHVKTHCLLDSFSFSDEKCLCASPLLFAPFCRARWEGPRLYLREASPSPPGPRCKLHQKSKWTIYWVRQLLGQCNCSASHVPYFGYVNTIFWGVNCNQCYAHWYTVLGYKTVVFVFSS